MPNTKEQSEHLPNFTRSKYFTYKCNLVTCFINPFRIMETSKLDRPIYVRMRYKYNSSVTLLGASMTRSWKPEICLAVLRGFMSSKHTVRIYVQFSLQLDANICLEVWLEGAGYNSIGFVWHLSKLQFCKADPVHYLCNHFYWSWNKIIIH